MQLSITGDGYIKCAADSDEHIISEQIAVINASNLSLPCMKDRYESNVLFYHIGDNISLADYIKSKVIDFEAIKELAINLANVFIKLEEAGLPNHKIIADIKYIFINSSTKQFKVLQCPIEEYEERTNYQKVMASICNNVKSKNAYIAIGFILEEIAQESFELKTFLKKIERLENARNGRNEELEVRRTVETKIVEKKVFVNKTSYLLCGVIAALFEIIGMIVIPAVFAMQEIPVTFFVKVISCTSVVLVTMLIFIIMMICTKSRNAKASTNDSQELRENAQIARNMNAGREISPVEEVRKSVTPEPRKQPVAIDFDETGLLEEEVEINPQKRQEQYNKKAVPVAYLVDEETNKKHQIMKNVIIVGRSNECDVVVNSTIVSKKHAEILYKNNTFYVKDLKSSNFTYLNKATIEPMELYKIEDGSRIGFGNKWFIFKTSL